MLNFREAKEPVLTYMLKSTTPEDILVEIKKGIKQGAQAFGFQMDLLKAKDRSEEQLKPIFEAMEGRPSYITNYNRSDSLEEPQDDEQLTAEMIVAVKCGAKLFDIRGDLFDPSPDEMSYDEKIIAKQMALVEQVHAIGGEVLMSCHVFRYLPPEEVLKIAKSQESRGVDFVKIVVNSDTEEELYSNLEITSMLRREISVPVLFLSNGDHCRLHRIYGPFLGKPAPFLVADNDGHDIAQPHICDGIEVLKLAKRKNER